MKKAFAILMSLVLMLSLAVPAMADDASPVTYTITVPSTDTHTYEVYQIFTGDFYDGILSNLVWGKNGTGYVAGAEKQEKVPDEVLNALKAVTDSTSDSAKLAVIDDYVSLNSEKYGTVSSTNSLSVAPGYYLLKDADNSLNGADDAYTTYIVQIVDNVNVTRKAVKPSVDKQVWDETADAEAGSTNGWGETADHAIGETFQFKLIATITGDTDYNAYETYKLVFSDTWSEGVTYIGNETVTIVSGGTTIKLENGQYSANVDAEKRTLSITIDDIKSIASVDLTKDTTVTVIYDAKLNDKAVIGNIDNNKNTVYLEYSNNPNIDGGSELGKTLEDTVWVFTYEMKNTKTTGTGDKLAGATFAIKNAEKTMYYGGVVEGKVKWVESTDPAKDDNVYKVTSDAQGNFTVVGLDVGTYILTEIVTPAGYNTCADVTVVISADHEELDKDNAKTTITMTKDGSSENVTEIIVVNQSGTVLPETGGMGTTIFYIVGGVMVAAAVVLLITKKRMSAEG